MERLHIPGLDKLQETNEALEQFDIRECDLECEAFPFESDSLDVVFSKSVIEHVENADNFLEETHRVLKPGGLAAIIEHNPWNPLTRVVVNRCDFDKDAILLSPGRSRKLMRDAGLDIVEQRYFVFFPFPVPGGNWLERGLWWLPAGAQYCVAAVKKQ